MIVFETVTKSFGSTKILDNISIEIKKGEVVVLIGPSGCGKSTFLRCINRLEPINAGKISIDGINIYDHSIDINKIRAEVGIVFQQFNLFPHMTVLDNITLAPIKVRKIDKKTAMEEAMSLLDMVNLASKAKVYPFSLSGGQRQRVAIARSLAMNPKVMLFDEPTSALDPRMTGEVIKVIQDLAKDGMTMVLVTHEVSIAQEIASRILFLNNGKIVQDSPPSTFLANPENQYIREFLESANIKS